MSGARVRVLGSGTALPTARRGCPGTLVELEDVSIALDFGAGSMSAMARAGRPPHRLDHIVLSHAHVDHLGDLVPLLFARHGPDLTDCSDLIVHGWPGFLDWFEGPRRSFGRWLDARHGSLTLRELDGRFEASTFRLLDAPVNHIPGARGVRLELRDGPTIAFSGDSDVCDELISLGRAADLLILECSFPDEAKVAGHLTPRECGEIASAAGCRRLLLTHFYPACDAVDVAAACREVWDGPLIIAEDGLELEL